MKYLDIYNKLKSHITSGKYDSKKRLPHIRELADIHSTSHKTISKVIKILEMEGLVKGIPSKGIFISIPEKRHIYAASRKTPVVAVLNSARLRAITSSPHNSSILWGVEEGGHFQLG